MILRHRLFGIPKKLKGKNMKLLGYYLVLEAINSILKNLKNAN